MDKRRSTKTVDATASWSKVWGWCNPVYDTTGTQLIPGLWYEECRCRDERSASEIQRMYQHKYPGILYRVLVDKPTDEPDNTPNYVYGDTRKEE